MPDNGLGALDKRILEIVAALSGDSLRSCTEAAAQPILEDARAGASQHARTGDVVKNLALVSTSTESSATTAVEVLDSERGGSAHEAVFEEYGTSKQVARPFLRPAFEKRKPEARAAFAGELSNKLNGI